MDNLASILDGEERMLRRTPPDDAFFRDYRDYLVKVLGRSPATARSYIGQARRVVTLTGKPVLKVDSDDLIAIMQSQPWAPASKRSMVVAFHSLTAYAQMKGYPTNGIAHLKTPSVPRNKRAPISGADAHRLLLASVTPIQVRVSYLGLYAGLRIEESTNVSEESWLEDRLVIIGKGSKKRTVPVHPELAHRRDHILSKRPASKTSAGVIFGRLRDRLELTDVEGKPATPHSLRRTFATTLYGAQVPWERVQKLLGHDLGVTDRYVWMSDEAMDGDVRKVEYSDGQPVQLTLDLEGEW